MTISKIIDNFYANSNFSKDGEVDLFRNLAKAIEANSNSAFIDETHGATKCNVIFDLTPGSSTRCEIADLLIIVKSDHSRYLRGTFWQAKKQKNPKWIATPAQDSHLDFKGQFNQWDLLSRRPKLDGVKPFNPPADLLESFDSGSIGSFGVFYESHSSIEMMHSIAEFISCASPKVKHPTMIINGHLEKYYYAHEEVIMRSTLRGFLEALFSHQIGAPLMTMKSTHKWLLSYAFSKARAASNIDPEQFFSNIEPLTTDEFNAGSNDGLSVLLVDSSLDFNS